MQQKRPLSIRCFWKKILLRGVVYTEKNTFENDKKTNSFFIFGYFWSVSLITRKKRQKNTFVLSQEAVLFGFIWHDFHFSCQMKQKQKLIFWFVFCVIWKNRRENHLCLLKFVFFTTTLHAHLSCIMCVLWLSSSPSPLSCLVLSCSTPITNRLILVFSNLQMMHRDRMLQVLTAIEMLGVLGSYATSTWTFAIIPNLTLSSLNA